MKNISTDNETLELNKKFPIENLIFYHCKLNSCDFSNVNFHFCKFINCFLDDVDFSHGNLWGTLFINCTLENAVFTNTECEGTEFRNCYGLDIKQLESMYFTNKNQCKKDFLLILPDEENTENDPSIYKIKRFYDESDYSEWKKSTERIKPR